MISASDPKIIQQIQAAIQELQRAQRNQPTEFTISGTTDSTPDTKKLWSHNLKSIPSRWYPVSGDVYVFTMTANQVDVRSTKASQAFTIIIS